MARINQHLSITVEIENGSFMNKAHVVLFDHTTDDIIRTIRGQYVLDGTTAEDFANEVINDSLRDVIDRYTVLANMLENATPHDAYVIRHWIKNDPQFNDAKWHGDDRK